MNTAFLFAGQGSQYVGMGKDLYDKYSLAREYFDQADQLIPNLKKICFEGPEEELKQTKYTQSSIYVLCVIVNDLIKREKGIKADVVAGFSLGEYSALYASGCFDFQTGLDLVRIRGEAMAEAGMKNPGTMAAVLGLEDDIVEEVCRQITDKGEIVVPVNYNSPGQLVISGTQKGVEEAVRVLEEKGALRAIILKVSGAFHSPLMKPADKILGKALEGVELKEPEIPVIMNVTASLETDPARIKELMVKQVVSPVLWKNSMQEMLNKRIKSFYELGPGKVLAGFMKKIERQVRVINIQSHEDINQIQ
ncbi:MAG: ACP S-malonyltransferase [Spirochaetes bacterium]|nr:ACP S-malonyltransferase [Spirochaetota bacterium]